MTVEISIVDYGIGNLYSVARAIEKVGGQPRLVSEAREIETAERLVLPGVGAFRDGMAGLRAAGLDDAVRAFAATERPLLGICLGMQMLATQSSEFGTHTGLGILPGRVEAIPTSGAGGELHKVPFIGWANLRPVQTQGFAGTILDSIGTDDAVYLVHSYQFLPDGSDDLLATYSYGQLIINAAVRRRNITGCQFHPEKSGVVGLGILNRFIQS